MDITNSIVAGAVAGFSISLGNYIFNRHTEKRIEQLINKINNR